MGEVRVPATALWRAQTQRAVENFPLSGMHDRPRADLRARRRSRAAPPGSTASSACIDADIADAIHDAAQEVARGEHDDQFPIDVFQTGSGTSSNMNANEVIATLASRRLGRDVHPNDHVNASQSQQRRLPDVRSTSPRPARSSTT